MTELRESGEGRREILRQVSVALGRPVTLWEVSSRAELEPRLWVGEPADEAESREVRAALRRWSIPVLQGSRWLGCASEQGWVVAPIRTQPPAPPPGGHERRSASRLTLELAGLCLGLADGTASAPRGARAGAATPLSDLEHLPALIAHELGNRLTTARGALQLAMQSLGRSRAVQPGERLELLEELGQVLDDIDGGVQFLRAVKDRARGALARWERFDAARVVQSCCTLEGRVLKERLPLELEGSLESVYLLGDPNALYDALVNLIRNATDASAGRSAPIRVRFERADQALRLTVRDEGQGIAGHTLERIFEAGFTTKGFGEGAGMGLSLVQDVVQNMFGGTIGVESTVGVGTTITVTLPIPAQRAADPPAPRRHQQASV